jgi:hypothetical protein
LIKTPKLNIFQHISTDIPSHFGKGGPFNLFGLRMGPISSGAGISLPDSIVWAVGGEMGVLQAMERVFLINMECRKMSDEHMISMMLTRAQ